MILEPADEEDFRSTPPLTCGTLVGHRLYLLPRPNVRHSLAETRLSALMHGDGPTGGWWILAEVEIHLDVKSQDGPFMFVPDLAGWRKERLPVLPDVSHLEIAPDWVCEILSPSNRSMDYTVKLPRFAHHGIPWVWFIDLKNQKLSAMQLTDGGYQVIAEFSGVETVNAEPFPDLRFDLSELWS